jgi:hypothetical protein
MGMYQMLRLGQHDGLNQHAHVQSFCLLLDTWPWPRGQTSNLLALAGQIRWTQLWQPCGHFHDQNGCSWQQLNWAFSFHSLDHLGVLAIIAGRLLEGGDALGVKGLNDPLTTGYGQHSI